MTTSRTRSSSPLQRAVLGSLAVLALVGVARQITQNWGARSDETESGLAGDLLIPHASVSTTRAITIDAPPAAVWPWIAQLGWERGGFYSYDQLENALGLDIHNATAVCETWQISEVGDEVHLTEELTLRVAMLQPERHLVLAGSPGGAGTDAQGPAFDFSWAFVLEELPSVEEDVSTTRTRLIVRERYGADSVLGRAEVAAIQPASFVMTQKMLRGIRDRAEGTLAPS